ncbi:hypothetical protein ES703_38643 [subsurface metagenome]
MSATDIFYNHATSIVPIGWAYRREVDKLDIPREMLIEGGRKGQPINVFPCATAFLLTIDENKTRFVTANHAFPDSQQDKAEICVLVPDYFKCPFEVSPDDIKAYLGVTEYMRLESQDICIFEADTPEALYIQHPTPLPLSFDFKVGDEVCTIGYPFIGYEGRVTDGRRDFRFVERLTCAHLSAIWPDIDSLTLEFDNYVGPGNSGGPLISIRTGGVIGVVTWSRLEGQHHSGTTFSHATCIAALNEAKGKFTDLPEIGPSPSVLQDKRND